MSIEMNDLMSIDLEQEYISVNFATRITFRNNGCDWTPKDVDDCVYSIDGRIETEEGTELGHIHCYYIEGDKVIRYNLPLIDTFDCIDSSLCAIGEHIIDVHTGELKEEVFGNDSISYDFLYIQELYISPEYRGHHLGLKVIRVAIERVCKNCTAVILHAYPLDTSKDKEGGVKATLIQYYGTIGFEQIGNTDYMLKNLCYTYP